MKALISIIVVVLFLSIKSFSQNKMCDTISIKQMVLYEFSNDLISMDDMILRENSFVLCKMNKVKYKKGLVYIDNFASSGKLNVLCNINSNNLKVNSDSICKVLDELKTGTIITNDGHTFKKVKVDIIAIFLGINKVSYIKKRKIRVVKAPCYKLISIKKIESVEN